MSTSDRPTPPADLSLKYMAWDIKKIGEKLDSLASLPQLVHQLEILNNTLVAMHTSGGAHNKITKLVTSAATNNDEIPF